jgi:2-polyprenyl-3-methyl-5-hydroxy-6-metoxy-1,4-benzoquinol methylase
MKTAVLPDGLVWSACPICGHDRSRSVHVEPMGELSSPLTGRFPAGLQMSVVRCDRCAFMYANPRPSQAVLADRYQHLTDMNYNLSGQQARVRVFDFLMSRLDARTNGTPKGRLLDVGCFCGTLLSSAVRHGWEPWGVELNRVAGGYARDTLGFNVTTTTLEDAGHADGFFDAVTMTDVAEHVADPLATFHEAYRILSPGGLLAFVSPHGAVQIRKEALKARLGRGRGLVIGGLAHINHFTPRTARSVLRGVGFDRIEIGCSFPEVDQSPRVDRAKRLYTAAARAIHAVTRLHVGHELLVIARKPS